MYILNNQHVLAIDIFIQIFEDFLHHGCGHAATVAGGGHKVDFMRYLELHGTGPP